MNRATKKIRTFLLLSTSDKKLFFKAFLMSAFVRFVTLYFPMRLWYKAMIGEQTKVLDFKLNEQLTPDKLARLRRIRQMVKLACRYAPWQAKCLVESILIKKLVGKSYNLPIYLGINKTENKYSAHAWVVPTEKCNKQYNVVSVHN